MNIKIEGVEKLIKKLQNVSAGGNAIIEKGLMKAGKRVQASAKMLCAFDTGQLKNSIVSEKVAPLTVSVGTNTEYAIFIEFGTGTKGDPKVAHTDKESWTYMGSDGRFYTSHGQPPCPFLQPALNQNKEQIAEDIKREIIGGLRA